MTCIIGAEFNGKVYMAGDIQGTGGNSKIVHTQPKVFKKKNVIFGYTTSYRFGQIIEHNLEHPIEPNSEAEIYPWLVTVLIPKLKNTLIDHGYSDGGQCLIGIKNQLWSLQNDYSVLRSVRGYDACGSGAEYALGSISTNTIDPMRTTDAEYRRMLRKAIEIAGIYSPSVGMDSTIITT